MQDKINQSLDILREVAKKHPVALISYSGGKDSLVVTDLASKVFQQIIGFYLWIVPGISIAEKQIEFAKERWDMDVIQYPDFLLNQYLFYGVYCDPDRTGNVKSKMKMKDMYNIIRQDIGTELVVTGHRRAESLKRRTRMHLEQNLVIQPIQSWAKIHVVTYCAMNNIPLPDAARGDISGLGLDDGTLLWLHDKYPEDFKKVKAIFPYVEVPVKRREFFGE